MRVRHRAPGYRAPGRGVPRGDWRGAARGGTTLVELLVAIPLAMTAAAVAAIFVVRLSHTIRGQSSTLANTRELRHATRVLATDLEPLGGRDVHSVSDTLLDFSAQLGVLALCDASVSQEIIAATPSATEDAWVASLRPGDRVRVWRPAEAQRPPVAASRALTRVPEALPAAGCGTDTMPGRRWRLVFGDTVGQIAAGTPVSVHREVRYRHYRSGGAWWLGRQSRHAGTWETIQPVAGPMRAPADGGVTMTARDANGDPLRIAASTADTARARMIAVALTIAMTRRTARIAGRTVDSASVLVPLRADASRRR